MVDIRNIKNIIFDLGGVILNIEPKLTAEAFKKLGYDNFESVYTKLSQSELFDRLEIGDISPEKFISGLKTGLDDSISEKQVTGAWNSLLLDFPDERISLIQKLKKRYRLFLLSNTNKIHYDFYTRCFREQYVFNFSALFEKAYYSFLSKMKKPDLEFFRLVIDENRLTPFETLFIDDTETNVKAAEKAGLRACWLRPGETINSIGLL